MSIKLYLLCQKACKFNTKIDLVQNLRKWAVQFNASHACANEMLKILRSTSSQSSQSSKTQFWPILLSFINVPIFSNKIFLVGIYYSFKGKPGDVNVYLRSFINELNSIITSGIKINDKLINFEVAHIVADTPAKAYLLNVKNYNGYFACTSREVEGDIIIDNKVCFLDFSAPLRKNNSFRLKSNSEYHKDGFSPLIDRSLIN